MQVIYNQIKTSEIHCIDHNEIANYICLDSNCQKKGIICCICQSLNHKEHQTKPLKYFINQLTKPLSSSTRLVIITSNIDKCIQNIRQTFNQIQNQRERTELQITFKQYLKIIYQKIQQQLSVQQSISKFLQRNSNSSLKKLNQLFLQFKIYENIQSEDQLPYNLNQQKYLNQVKQTLESQLQQLKQTLKSKKHEFIDLLKIFTYSQQSKNKVSYYFSQQLKHTSINITDKMKATQSHNYSANFCIIQPAIYTKKLNKQKRTIKIKIDQFMSWITIGVCIKSKVTAANYLFSTDNVGTHGAYTVSYDGYSWHNDDSSLNSYYHGWGFSQGDVIIVTFDPKAKTIKWTKQGNSDDKGYQMACEPTLGQDMHFCVSLNSHDQSVSIVE